MIELLFNPLEKLYDCKGYESYKKYIQKIEPQKTNKMKELILVDLTDIISVRVGNEGTIINGEDLLSAIALFYNTKAEMEEDGL